MERNIISRGRRSHEEITLLLEQKVQEGISTKDFCKMNGVTTSTFYNWRAPMKAV
ncbi:transposase [Chitinophaga sp. S165]|uniref:transposase n=1 Tax=Chitinophaga sp. S165 TaxID=2135462 RepID=UPI001304D762|nr:transposase [Chitinophaga sp. S165]